MTTLYHLSNRTDRSNFIPPDQNLNALNVRNIRDYLTSSYYASRLNILPFETIKSSIKQSAFKNNSLDNVHLCLYPHSENFYLPIIHDFKYNFLGLAQDEKPILSRFSKTFFNKFNNIPIQTNYKFKDLSQLLSNRSTANTFNNNGVWKDLPTLSFSPLIKESEDLRFYDVISLKAPCSGATYEIKYDKITKKKYLKGESALIPVLLPIKVYDNINLNFYDAYIFTFNLDISIAKINKYKKIKAYLSLFFKNGFDYESTYFYDLELYNNLKSVSFFLKVSDKNASPSFIKILENNPKLSNNNSLIKYILKNDFLLSSKNVDYPLTLISKENKLNKKISALDSWFSSREEQVDILAINKSIQNKNIRISYLEEKALQIALELTDAKNSLTKHLQHKSNYLDTINSWLSSLSLNTNKYKALADKKANLINYKKEIRSSLPFKEDLTLSNMLDNIEIVNIEFSNNRTWLADEDFSEEYIQKNKITQVLFSTKKPSKITLVNKTKSIVGGPYLIKVTPTSLELKPKDFTANLGFHRNMIYIHPHCSQTNFNSDRNIFNTWYSACLGEASGLIYKAFEKNDLKMILIAVQCWLTSANQADTWGKNYVHFTPWEEYEDFVNFKQNTSEEQLASYKELLDKYLVKEPIYYQPPPTVPLPEEIVLPSNGDSESEDLISTSSDSQDSNLIQSEDQPSLDYVPYVSNTWS